MENEQYAHPFNFWRINYGNRICSCGKSEDDEIHVDSVVLRDQIAEAVFESDAKLDKTLIKYYEDQGYSFDEALGMANTEQLHSIESELFRVFSLISGEKET